MILRDGEICMGQTKILPDIIEAKTADEANAIDKRIYRLERFSESRQCYIYVKRKDV
jgi:hypothetical protein